MVLNCEFSQIILEISKVWTSGREDIGIRKFEFAALKNHMRNSTNLACEKMKNNVFYKIGKTTFAKKKIIFFVIQFFLCEISQKANIFALFSTKEMRINAKFLSKQKMWNFKQFVNFTGNPNLEAVMLSRIISWIPG